MMFVRYVLISVLFVGLARAQDAGFADPDAASDAEQMQAHRALLNDAVRQVTSGREAWLLANALSFPQAQATAHDRAIIAALRARAASERDSDPLLLRLTIADSGVRGSTPEQADALYAQLDALDPGNAFNSLAVMGVAPKDYADPSYDQRVQEMAAASHYRSDYTAVLRTGYAAMARAYGLAAIPSQAEVETRTAEMYQAGIAAAGVAAAMALPGFGRLTQACDIARFPARTEPCRRVAERMYDDTDTLLDRMIALALLKRTVTDDADRTRVQALKREADWQLAAYQDLMFRSFGTEAMVVDNVRHLTAILRRGELAAMRDLLAAHAVPLQPPADWQPRR